jgi:hypothetical protein
MHGRVRAECVQEERAHAEAHSSLANDAVATLRCPLRRSRHLLQLTTGTGGEEEAEAGAGAGASATITDASLLMRVMEAREAVEEAADAGDAGQLRRLAAANAADRAQCEVPTAASSTAAPSDCPDCWCFPPSRLDPYRARRLFRADGLALPILLQLARHRHASGCLRISTVPIFTWNDSG